MLELQQWQQNAAHQAAQNAMGNLLGNQNFVYATPTTTATTYSSANLGL